jgi:hypothetical protein
MMKTVYLQDWVLKIDVEKTKEYYNPTFTVKKVAKPIVVVTMGFLRFGF